MISICSHHTHIGQWVKATVFVVSKNGHERGSWRGCFWMFGGVRSLYVNLEGKGVLARRCFRHGNLKMFFALVPLQLFVAANKTD